MFEIHIKGEKKAALLAWQSALGYGEADVLLEEGSDEEYVIHCEISTKYDANPFEPNSMSESVREWNGETINLEEYSESDIRNGKYYLQFECVGLKYLTGFLNLEMELLNRPDDELPVWMFEHWNKGTCIENESYKAEDADDDALYDEFMDGMDIDEDMDLEDLEMPELPVWKGFDF